MLLLLSNDGRQDSSGTKLFVICLEKSQEPCTYYIIVHGGVVTAKVADVNHRRSPFVQGGLEIPVIVSVVMLMPTQTKTNEQSTHTKPW